MVMFKKCLKKTELTLLVENGSIKDPYSPSVFGVGITGVKYQTTINGVNTKEYDLWKDMLRRCYAYSYVDEYGHPIDLNIVADTYLDDEGFVNGVTYCKIPTVDVMVNLVLSILVVIYLMKIANIVVI